MSMGADNAGFESLQPYPFEKLRQLLEGVTPSTPDPIPLSIGEPRHEPPAFVLDAYRDALAEGVSRYPTIQGSEALRDACRAWLARRFGVRVDDDMVQPVNGTREALFAVAQAFIRSGSGQKVLMPNPFYQIYEGAALMAGAEPHYLNVSSEDDFLPDLEAINAETLAATRIFYLCSPVNPCGTIASLAYLQRLVELAIRYDFIVVADECYIELYRGTAPVSILNAASALSLPRPCANVLAFHSLSKRSNLPGLRSGFVAGDADLIARYRAYRTYHGCSMSLAVQKASIAAWSDDTHVAANRALYDQKFTDAGRILATALAIEIPPAAFYLWPNIGGDDVAFCRDLFAHTHVTAVPGSYLSREVDGVNPGSGYVRLSLVAEPHATRTALERIAAFIKGD
ncbi:MAG: succinyldiaminopimelate transaminase [Pseudomonadota bacterium]